MIWLSGQNILRPLRRFLPLRTVGVPAQEDHQEEVVEVVVAGQYHR